MGRGGLPPLPLQLCTCNLVLLFYSIAILLSLGYSYFLDFKKGKQLEVDSFQSKLPSFQNVLNEEKNKIFLPSVKKASDYELFNNTWIEPSFSCGIVACKLLGMGDSTAAHNFTLNITDKLRALLESKSTQYIQRGQMFNKFYNIVILKELVSSQEKLLTQSEDIGLNMVKN